MTTLRSLIEQAEFDIPETTIPKLQQYCELLWEKNKVMNLTRHTDFEHFVNRDLLDSIMVAKQLPDNADVLDIGSGGGVPGVVLKILRPDLNMTLCDSVGKKAQALREIAEKLDVELEVYHGRAENLLEDERYDAVTARAVGSLAKLFRWLDGNWVNITKLLAIKGPKWREERLEAESARLMRYLQLKIVERYPVPGEEWESFILEIRSSR
ncbi:MAG: 16S rRNA (guanine(527)-N(7))-methyltransferase RsmG [Pirellulaceae bacterium]